MEAWRATNSNIVYERISYCFYYYNLTTRALYIHVDLLLGPVIHLSMLFISSLLSYRSKNWVFQCQKKMLGLQK